MVFRGSLPQNQNPIHSGWAPKTANSPYTMMVEHALLPSHSGRRGILDWSSRTPHEEAGSISAKRHAGPWIDPHPSLRSIPASRRTHPPNPPCTSGPFALVPRETLPPNFLWTSSRASHKKRRCSTWNTAMGPGLISRYKTPKRLYPTPHR